MQVLIQLVGMKEQIQQNRGGGNLHGQLGDSVKNLLQLFSREPRG